MDKNIYRIVVGYDQSELSERALDVGFELAAREEHAEVHAVYVNTLVPVAMNPNLIVPSLGTLESAVLEDQGAAAAHLVQRLSAWQEQRQRTFSRLSVHVQTGDPAREIAQLCSDVQAHLAIVGTHGRTGIKRLLLGSVAEGVVRLAHCPVLVIKDPAEAVVEPRIEPACPQCIEERRATEGRELWCEQHREKHGARHTYHYESKVGAPANMGLVMHQS